jgi:hypothetical protein
MEMRVGRKLTCFKELPNFSRKLRREKKKEGKGEGNGEGKGERERQRLTCEREQRETDTSTRVFELTSCASSLLWKRERKIEWGTTAPYELRKKKKKEKEEEVERDRRRERAEAKETTGRTHEPRCPLFLYLTSTLRARSRGLGIIPSQSLMGDCDRERQKVSEW